MQSSGMRSPAFIKHVAFCPIFKMLDFIHNLGNNIIDPEKITRLRTRDTNAPDNRCNQIYSSQYN